MCASYCMKYQGKIFCLGLFCLPMKGLDVILGMDWLMAHKVVIDCATKIVKILDTGIVLYYTHLPKPVCAGVPKCHNVAVYMILFSVEATITCDLSTISVVREFPGVFPNDIEALPPERGDP